MAAAASHLAVHGRPGHLLVSRQDFLRVFPVRDGKGDGAALSLRSVDAAGLESVPADVAALGGSDGGPGPPLPPPSLRPHMATLDRTARRVFFWAVVPA